MVLATQKGLLHVGGDGFSLILDTSGHTSRLLDNSWWDPRDAWGTGITPELPGKWSPRRSPSNGRCANWRWHGSALRFSPDEIMPSTGSEMPADDRQADSSKLHMCPSHIPQSAKQTQQLVGMYQGDDFNPEQGFFVLFLFFCLL